MGTSSRRTFTYALRTDPAGQIPNEDSCAVLHLPGAVALLVADGVGGQACGEIASQIVIDAAGMFLAAEASAFVPGPEALRGAFESAQYLLRDFLSRTQTARSARSTLLVALATRTHVWIGHVGDCRAYLARNGTLERLTRDDTLAQSLFDMGHIDGAAAQAHSQAHVLLQSMGDTVDLDYHITEAIPVVDGDVLVVCSDGLTDVLEDEQIAALSRTGTSESMAEALLGAALAQKPRDNVSVGVAVWRGAPESLRVDSRRRSGRARRSQAFAIAVAISVVLLVVVTLVGLSRKATGGAVARLPSTTRAAVQ